MTMPTIHRQSEEEIMQACRQSLRQRAETSNFDPLKDYKALRAREFKAGDYMSAEEMIARARRALLRLTPDLETLVEVAGDRPESFEKPKFGTPEYWLAYRVGWIPEQEVATDKTRYDERRRTSLRTCHRPAARPELFRHHDKGWAYVPELSARLINDPALSDGARRCAAKLMELVYRRNRHYRNFGCTVSYLAQCLNRSTRTVQNYLYELRSRGYISHEVVRSKKARMCIGILITLLKPIFPRHHRKEWPPQKLSWPYPENGRKSGVQKNSQKYLQFIKYIYFQERVSVDLWACRCMNGAFRAFTKANQTLLMKKTEPLAA
jgi:hypothetical protein